ncbi:MAG: S46 family peptidase [Pyrinomonadaceae bacterium]|nr:S46 family peptidase [Pyrinomonadaceae bacterium]
MNRQKIFSSLLTIAILFSTMSTAFAFDEGMFMPDQIAKLPLKQRGLKIKPIDIYNPAGGGLTDAVIRLSIGCTAEFVSPEGLILTNHHCGFDALVSASTPDKDLVETGFRTDGRSGEIAAKGYSIFITQRSEDVTAKIKAGTDGLSGDALAAAVKKNTDALQAAEQAKAPAGATIRIQAINSGFFYYLFQVMQVKDVRVVYAPPRNIGIFGGDPDNFEWTRHTGDFTFLRAYTAPDGSSAEYSPNNVPFKSKKFLSLNIGGLKDNDFVFVLGYPGSTTRFREHQSIEYARDANFPFLERWLNALSASLRQIGATNEEKRIAFQSDIASFDNSRKAFGGGHLRLRRSAVVQSRQAEEARMATWIAANPDRQKKYGTMLAEIKSLSDESNAAMMRDAIMRRFPDPNSMTVFGQVVAAVLATQIQGKMLKDDERAAKLKEIEKAYAEREADHELSMLKFFLKSFDELPAGQKFKPAEDLFGSLKGKARRDAEAAFAATIANGEYSSAQRTAGLYGPRTADFNPEREKILTFARGVAEERGAIAARSAKFAGGIDRLRLLYMQALVEMRGMLAYPDANSTLRFSFGNVKGYQSREAEYRTPFTTMKGMFEKDTGVNPFDAPQKLKDLHAAKDFGRFGSGDTVGLNFLSTTDIIGGNSGSPILNGNGEQVGLCFDGNFEGLGNDFYYDSAVNRTISVDIRYVLFVVEKFGNAGWMLNEMKLVDGKK